LWHRLPPHPSRSAELSPPLRLRAGKRQPPPARYAFSPPAPPVFPRGLGSRPFTPPASPTPDPGGTSPGRWAAAAAAPGAGPRAPGRLGSAGVWEHLALRARTNERHSVPGEGRSPGWQVWLSPPPASPTSAVLGLGRVARSGWPRRAAPACLRPAPLPRRRGRGARVPLRRLPARARGRRAALCSVCGGERLPPPLGFSLKSVEGGGGRRDEGGDGGELGYTTSALASAPSLETTTSPLFTSPLISPALFRAGREVGGREAAGS